MLIPWVLVHPYVVVGCVDVDKVIGWIVKGCVPELQAWRVNLWWANCCPSDVTHIYCPLSAALKFMITSVCPLFVMCEFNGRSPVAFQEKRNIKFCFSMSKNTLEMCWMHNPTIGCRLNQNEKLLVFQVCNLNDTVWFKW